MLYQVPQNIDSNKVFLVNFSELEGRLDPLFYTSQFVEITNALKKTTSYKLLGQVVNFSNEFWNQKDYYKESFPYIEIGAINITDGTIREIVYIPVEEAPSRAKVIVRTNDIIISTTRPGRGAIAKITEHENNYIVSTGFSVIRSVDGSVDRDYLFSILRLDILLKQMIQRSTGGNYPAITQEELSKVVVPIPSKEIQDRIVSIIQVALSEKQQKEKQAKVLLNSIDDYLLG
jgi:Restriction endonuclease S subunits